MKESAKPVAQRQAVSSSADRSAGSGPKGVALRPPAYGIDLADRPAPRRENRTGLPDRLKAGVEALSGLSMDAVRVHYNSDRPAQLQALAYTQGTNIYVGPGQKGHLAHEAWHVVQQAQGRVRPTIQMNGLALNEDAGLESEAETLGQKVLRGDGLGIMGDHTKSICRLVGEPQKAAAAPPPHVTQRAHVFIGTMLANPPYNPDPSFEDAPASYDMILTKRGYVFGTVTEIFPWAKAFSELRQLIVTARNKAEIAADRFPIIINANSLISPGYQSMPEPYSDDTQKVYAIGSAWGFGYDLDRQGNSFDYGKILREVTNMDKIQGGPRRAKSRYQSTKVPEKLGEDSAKKLLRRKTQDHFRPVERNAMIPHRGLRNFILSSTRFKEVSGSSETIAKQDQVGYLHIMALDNDVGFESSQVIKEITEITERELQNLALTVTATDYVYTHDDILLWFCSLLDKRGRMLLEDAYPAEPGLTISYRVESMAAATEFLANEPFGAEWWASNQDGTVAETGKFGELITSDQSKEGPNLRAKWIQYLKKEEGAAPAAASAAPAEEPMPRRLKVKRTLSYLRVNESAGQKKSHEKSLKKIRSKRKIDTETLLGLIQTDNYHSLTSQTRGATNPQEKIITKIIAAAVDVFNSVMETRQKSPPPPKRQRNESPSTASESDAARDQPTWKDIFHIQEVSEWDKIKDELDRKLCEKTTFLQPQQS